VSAVLDPVSAGFDVLAFLHEDGAGRTLAGLLDVEERTVRIVELTSAPKVRRRGVRR
jgi:hypothetical protein